MSTLAGVLDRAMLVCYMYTIDIEIGSLRGQIDFVKVGPFRVLGPFFKDF